MNLKLLSPDVLNQGRIRLLLVVLAVATGLLFSTKPLNADDVFFLHKAWSVAVQGTSPYTIYPFPLFPAIAGLVVRHLGLYGALWLKLAVCLLAIFFIFRTFRGRSVFYSFFGLVVFYLLLLNRFLDFRPELLATLASLALIYLLAAFRDSPLFRKPVFLLPWLVLLESLPFITPRYFIFSAFVGLVFLYLNRDRWLQIVLLALAALGLVLLLVVALAGLPPESFSALFKPDVRDVMSTKNRFRQMFGRNVLGLYLFIVVAMLVHVRRGRFFSGGMALLFAGVAAYIGFEFVVDPVPYRYVAQPTVLLIAAFVFFEFLQPRECCLGRDVFRARGRPFRFVTIFLLLLFSFNFIRDVSELSRSVRNWAVQDEVLACTSLPETRIITPEKLNPVQHVCLAQKVCAAYPGYTVFTDSYRWSPVCLPDRYSGDYWLGLLQREELVSRIEALPDHRKLLNDKDRGVYFYKE
ncbi:MAG: hypothetical protein RIR00_746 [Pseudomonadota bacterium]